MTIRSVDRTNLCLGQAINLPCVALALFVTGTTSIAEDKSSCPHVPPVAMLEGAPIYQDGMGSVPDPERERLSAELRTDLTEFLRLLHETYDPSARANTFAHCADIAIREWANARALMVPPTSATPRVERVLAAVALNSFFLKRSQAGQTATVEENAWLRGLTAAVAEDYNRESMANTLFYRNNVYFWSSAAQGMHAVLTRDETFIAASDQGWRDAMARIDTKGHIEPELRRGRRTLIYHQFSYSALLILRQTRFALGLTVSASDQAAMKRLSDAIGRALCDPTDICQRANAPDQERPGVWGFGVPTVFGPDLNGEMWRRCGIIPVGAIVDLRIGGDLHATRHALEQAAR